MKFYYVSREMENICKKFLPEFPLDNSGVPDSETRRVQLSSSLEGALSMVTWGGDNLADYQQCFLDKTSQDDSVYFRVYEFDIFDSDADLVTASDLHESDAVRTALITDEYWYLDEIIPTCTYLVRLMDWEEDELEVISYEDLQLLEHEDIGNQTSEKFIEEQDVEYVTRIFNLTYTVL